MIATKKCLDSLLHGQQAQPHSLLGMHPITHQGRRGLVVRAFLQDSRTCEVVDYQHTPEVRYPMTQISDLGCFETFIPHRPDVFRYRLRVEKNNGEIRQFYDPYSFLPTLSDQDLYLFNEGTEHRVYQKLGARLPGNRRRQGRLVRGLGAQRQPRVRGGRFQPLGRTIFSHAAAGQFRRVGNFYSGSGSGAALQI